MAGKNTVLRKFHVSIDLMTPVDREGIISKKYVGISILCLCWKVMTISKDLQAIILARFEHKIYAKCLLFVISKSYGKPLTIIEQFGKE